MEKAKYLIIGGGIAGTTAAEEIRKYDTEGSIVIVSKEGYPLYSRMLLPLYAGGKIQKESLYLKSDEFYDKKAINLLKGVEVLKVNARSRTAVLSSGEEYSFEKLLIATGGSPKKWDIPGGDLPEILRFHTISDSENIRSIIQSSSASAPNAVVVGSGLIGINLVKIFREFRINTRVLIRGGYYLSSVLDRQAGELLHRVLEGNDIEIIANTEVKKVIKTEKGISLSTTRGFLDGIDFVCVGIGLSPNVYFLRNSDIRVNTGVLTDEFLETSVPGIFAAGDVAEFKDIVAGRPRVVENWGNAMEQGRVAGYNMASGHKKSFEQIPLCTVTVFGNVINFIGDVSRDNAVAAIGRGSIKDGKYTQLFFRDNSLVGAVTINMVNENNILKTLIEEKRDLSSFKSRFLDSSFDLNNL